MKIDLFLKFGTKPGQILKIVNENRAATNLPLGVPSSMDYYDHHYWKTGLLIDVKEQEKNDLKYHYQFFPNDGGFTEDWETTVVFH